MVEGKINKWLKGISLKNIIKILLLKKNNYNNVYIIMGDDNNNMDDLLNTNI